jgi:hypothetical protein
MRQARAAGRLNYSHFGWVFGYGECVEIVAEQGGLRKAQLCLWFSHTNAAMRQCRRAMYPENSFVMGKV